MSDANEGSIVGGSWKQSNPPISLEIVVAHYLEDISWLRSHGEWTIVYHKGGDSSPTNYRTQSSLENVGRESHTYLYHIVNNYDDLADMTLFTQGKIADHLGPDVTADELVSACLTLQDDIVAFPAGGVFEPFDTRTEIPYSESERKQLISGEMQGALGSVWDFWRWLFGQQPMPDTIYFSPGAIFGVRRHVIHRRPREFYLRLFDILSFIRHNNPEEGHYMELIWMWIYAPATVGVPFANGRKHIKFSDLAPATRTAHAFHGKKHPVTEAEPTVYADLYKQGV